MSRAVILYSALVLIPCTFVLAEQGGAPSGPWQKESTNLPVDETPGSPRANGTDVLLGGTREPCIAVNPANRLNLAASSLFQYRVSTNGGATWTAAAFNTVPAGYGRDGDPSMAFDSQSRLFYTYQGFHGTSGGADEFMSEINPTTGALIAGPVMISTSGAAGSYNDKVWVAADRFAGSPFVDRLYSVWSEFPTAGSVRVLTSYSTNHGATWSAPLQVSLPAEGFPWPAHIGVAPNGDVYISYHAQPAFNGIGEAGGNPTGTSGRVYVVRSTNGGVSFPQKTLAYTAGQADLTFNVQSSTGNIPGTAFWLQGSAQAWILPDPNIPGNIYVVANDDPDDVHGSGDDANVYIARSTNNGLTWSAPARVDHGPGTTFAVMPTAHIDSDTGCIVVMWYDNRSGVLNGNGRYLLDVYFSVSSDHGLSFGADTKMNDVAFNPDSGSPSRYPGPPATLRIGEYIGVAFGGGDVAGIWTGNPAVSHQAITDTALARCRDCNNNHLDDPLDIALGTSLDCNVNTIPDECEFPGCTGILLTDMNCDGKRDGSDIRPFIGYVLTGRFTCQADANQDGAVNLLDADPFSTILVNAP